MSALDPVCLCGVILNVGRTDRTHPYRGVLPSCPEEAPQI